MTLIRTGIKCNKISACEWNIFENVEIFRSYVKYFWIFPREEKYRILISLCKKVFMNHPIMFLDRGNKTKLVVTSFPYFLKLSGVSHMLIFVGSASCYRSQVWGLLLMTFLKWEKLSNFKVYALLEPICAGEVLVIVVIDK